MTNALKGKTLTTWTIILPTEEVAKGFMESASGHFEFMQEKSYGPAQKKWTRNYCILDRVSSSLLSTVCCGIIGQHRSKSTVRNSGESND